MAEQKIDELKISEEEANAVRISNSADRPNAFNSYRESKKTAADVKKMFDAPFELLREKHDKSVDEIRKYNAAESDREAAEIARTEAEKERKRIFGEFYEDYSTGKLKGEKGDPGSVNVVQTTGDSENDAMSQKATTEAINAETPYYNLKGKFELGTVWLSGTTIMYTDATSCTRLKKGTTMHLNSGDVVSADDTAEFRIVRVDEGFVNAQGFITSFTVAESGNYIFALRLKADSPIDDIEALVDKLTISNNKSTTYKKLKGIDEKLKATTNEIAANFTDEAKIFLLQILRNCIYESNQSTNIKALESALGVTADGYKLVREITEDELLVGYACNPDGGSNYIAANSQRTCYPEWDISVSGGLYKFEFDVGNTSKTFNIGIQVHNEAALALVEGGKWAYNMATKENIFDDGWEVNGVELELPDTISNSPTACLRVVFKRANNTDMAVGDITAVRIYRKVV